MDLQTATRLYELRKQHGLSQEELAEKLGISRQAVSKWERAEASPDTDNLICLAKLYGISLDELLQMQPSTSPSTAVESPTEAVDQDDDKDDDDEPVGKVAKIIYSVIPLVCVVAFFILGGAFGLWHPGWLVFLGIPVLESLVAAIDRKNANAFAYPVLCALAYLCLGFFGGWWHPGWIVFVTIPLYYVIADLLDKRSDGDTYAQD